MYFLGTGQAVPTAKRNHTAMLLKYKDESLLIDCGEGTQRQFRKAKLNPCKITRILITHWHGDHILGLPGLLQTLVFNNYNKKLYIYGPEGTKCYLEKILNMFVMEGELDVEVREIMTGKVFETEDFVVESRKMKHGVKCLAYSFIEKDKLRIDKKKLPKVSHSPKISRLKEGKDVEVNGKKLKSKELTYEVKGRKITFVLDTGVNDNISKLAKNSDLLIGESTYLSKDEEKAGNYGHLTSKQIAKEAKKAGVDRLILTHLSQRYEGNEDKLLSEARSIFKNTTLSKDLMKIHLR